MSGDDLRPPGGLPALLFYRKRTNSFGECEEVSLGPSAVRVMRYVAVLLLAALLLCAGARPEALFQVFVKLLR